MSQPSRPLFRSMSDRGRLGRPWGAFVLLGALLWGCGDTDTYGHLSARCALADNDIVPVRWGLFSPAALGGAIELEFDAASGGIQLTGDTSFAPDPLRLIPLAGGRFAANGSTELRALDDAPRDYVALCYADVDDDGRFTIGRAEPSERARALDVQIEGQTYRLTQLRYVPSLDVTEAYVTATDGTNGRRRITSRYQRTFRTELALPLDDRVLLAPLGATPP